MCARLIVDMAKFFSRDEPAMHIETLFISTRFNETVADVGNISQHRLVECMALTCANYISSQAAGPAYFAPLGRP